MLKLLEPKLKRARATCGSPIEVMMLDALVRAALDRGDAVRVRSGNGAVDFAVGDESLGTLVVTTQQPVGPFRADLGVQYVGRATRRPAVLVECDGHKWHDRTKEQAAKDRERQNMIVLAGHMVLRFTGSQIWADAEACAEDVIVGACG